MFVDDGSTDGTADRLKERTRSRPARCCPPPGRTCGGALSAGFGMPGGDLIVTMDGDRQNSPALIFPGFSTNYREGYDIVSGWRVHRKDHSSWRIPSRITNKRSLSSREVRLRLRLFSQDLSGRYDLGWGATPDAQTQGTAHRGVTARAAFSPGYRGLLPAHRYDPSRRRGSVTP